MIRLGTACLAVLALQAQDPISAESRFRALLDRVEKTGLAVPDLPDGAAELQKLLAATKALPKDLRDRYAVVRSQSSVLASLHALLLKNKGGLLDFPVPTGKPVSVKIVDVMKRSVKISRPEGTQDFAYSDLDPEWVLSSARAGFSTESEAPLLAGLWLAKAARWDAAFLALADVDTDHPLAAEARKRGTEAAAAGLDALIKGKRWTETLARLESLDKLAPDDARLKTARAKLLDAMVEHGKDLCRKKSKGPMKDLIDLITKHFPDGSDRIEDIREAVRWIKVTDPKKFQEEGMKGPPWLLDSGAKDAGGAWFAESADSYTGIMVKMRFEKNATSMGGLIWDDVRLAWINSKEKLLAVGSGNKGESIQSYNHQPVAVEGPHVLTLRIRDRNYVLHYNGAEFDRAETKKTSLERLGLNVNKGRVWFDEVWLLKKE